MKRGYRRRRAEYTLAAQHIDSAKTKRRARNSVTCNSDSDVAIYGRTRCLANGKFIVSHHCFSVRFLRVRRRRRSRDVRVPGRTPAGHAKRLVGFGFHHVQVQRRNVPRGQRHIWRLSTARNGNLVFRLIFSRALRLVKRPAWVHRVKRICAKKKNNTRLIHVKTRHNRVHLSF